MTSKLGLAALSFLILYFAFHAFAGRQGLGAWSDLQAEVNDLKRELNALENVRDQLKTEIAMLDPDDPDADFIETLARENLGYVRPDEILIALQH